MLRKKTLPKTQTLVAAWDAVTTETVVNCLRESKISSKSKKTAIAEKNDRLKELEEEIENLHSIQPDLVSENNDAASFTDVDSEVLAVQSPPSGAEMVAELLETEDVSNGKDDAIATKDEPVYWPDRNELLKIH